MKPKPITTDDLNAWRRTTWTRYAFEARNGINIQLLCNFFGLFRVMQGSLLYWEGADPEEAVKNYYEA